MTTIPDNVPPEYAELYENLCRFEGKLGKGLWMFDSGEVFKTLARLTKPCVVGSLCYSLLSFPPIPYTPDILREILKDLPPFIGTPIIDSQRQYIIHEKGFSCRVGEYYGTFELIDEVNDDTSNQ